MPDYGPRQTFYLTGFRNQEACHWWVLRFSDTLSPKSFRCQAIEEATCRQPLPAHMYITHMSLVSFSCSLLAATDIYSVPVLVFSLRPITLPLIVLNEYLLKFFH